MPATLLAHADDGERSTAGVSPIDDYPVCLRRTVDQGKRGGSHVATAREVRRESHADAVEWSDSHYGIRLDAAWTDLRSDSDSHAASGNCYVGKDCSEFKPLASSSVTSKQLDSRNAGRTAFNVHAQVWVRKGANYRELRSRWLEHPLLVVSLIAEGELEILP